MITKQEYVTGETFTVSIESFEEYIMQKPIILYVMPNGRYYPLSTRVKMQDGSFQERPDLTRVFLEAIEQSTTLIKDFNHKLRQSGASQEEAFQKTMGIHPILVGLPKSRIIESGFKIIELRDWKK